MEKLIKFLVNSIVNNPKKVNLEKINDPKTDYIRFLLEVDPEDMGRIIGKQGRIIKAIRNLIYVKSIIDKKRVFLTLKEKGRDFLFQ